MTFDIRHGAFAAVSLVLLCTTTYSVIYNTYLDTSNPLVANLPHPLHSTDYFANKSNILNVWFIKKAWGWTTFAFLLLWFTSPSQTQTKERVFKWIADTLVWLAFTSWFFGPAILERVTAASGGECMMVLPQGGALAVPTEYCFTRSTISSATHPSLFAASLLVPDASWQGIPRFRKGHDVSGHVFLLTMSILFLSDQLRSSLSTSKWPPMHKYAIAANVTLIAIWLFASYTTGVYFHSPIEKLTGYLLGVAGFAITQLSIFENPPATHRRKEHAE